LPNQLFDADAATAPLALPWPAWRRCSPFIDYEQLGIKASTIQARWERIGQSDDIKWSNNDWIKPRVLFWESFAPRIF
jgi:hypothetical protein